MRVDVDNAQSLPNIQTLHIPFEIVSQELQNCIVFAQKP